MRKKFGFKDFISKSLPLKINIPSYIPLTRKTFTNMSQIKKGMRLVYYNGVCGDILTRRSKIPNIVVVSSNFSPTSDIYVKTKGFAGLTVYLNKKEIFFYEEEKSLGRVR